MVLAAKVFIIKADVDLDTIAIKLKDYRVEEEVELEGRKLRLLTEVRDLNIGEGHLQAVFSQDQIINVYQRGKPTPILKTIEAPILFTYHKDYIVLIVLEKKQRANSIANILSKHLFITTGKVVEAKIPPEALQSFHEQSYEDTKVIFFDDVDVPSVEKLSLYGSALADTSLYADYLAHGKLWYVVIKSKKYGYVVGLTRNAVVTIFSKIDEQEFIDYIKKEVLPLIP